MVNLLFYFGRNTSYDPEVDTASGQAIKVFSTLMKPLGNGLHIFAAGIIQQERPEPSVTAVNILHGKKGLH